MLSAVRKLLTPPVFADDEQTRQARIVHRVLLISVAGLSPFIVLSGVQGGFSAMWAMIITVGVNIVGLGVLQRGNLTLPAFIVPLLGVGVTTFIVITGDNGVHGVSVPGYFVVLVVASLLVGRRGPAIFGVLTAVVIALVIYAEVNGVVTNKFSANTTYTEIISYSTLTLMIAGVLHVLVNSLANSADQARASARALSHTNQELKTLSGDLEKRVEARTSELSQAQAQTEERAHALTQAQARTQELLTQLDEASRLTRLASFEMELDPLMFVFSDRFYELLGTSASAQGGYRKPLIAAIRHFTHPADVKRMLAEVQDIFANSIQHAQQLEYRLQHTDGTLRDFAFSFQVKRDAQGRPTSASGAVQDVTERKAVEAAIRYRAEIDRLLSEISSAFVNVETDDIAVEMNSTVQKLGEFAQVDRCYVFQYAPDLSVINCTQEWCAPGVAPEIETLQRLPVNPTSWWTRRILRAETVHIPRVADMPAEASSFREGFQAQGIQSIIAVPLAYGKTVMGYIGFDSVQAEKTWASQDITLMLLVAQTLSSALVRQQAQLAERRGRDTLAKRAAELETVTQLATSIATIADPREMLQAVVDLVKPSFGLYHAHIYLLNESGDNLVLTAGAGEAGRIMVDEKRTIPLAREQSLVARAARTRQPVSINDVTAAPDFLPNPLLPDTKSELAVPLLVGGVVLGVLDVQSNAIDHFTPEDARIQTILAAQIATALQNARSRERSEQARHEVDALNRRLTREGWQDYFTRTSTRVGYMFDEEQVTALTSERALTNERALSSEGAPNGNGSATLTRPILIGGEPIGHVRVSNDDTAIGELEEVLSAVTRGLSGHLENLRLTEQTQATLAETELLYNASRRLAAATDLQEVVASVAEGVPNPSLNRALLLTFTRDAQGELEAASASANWHRGQGTPPTSIGTVFPKGLFTALPLLTHSQGLFSEDVLTDPRLNATSRATLAQAKVRALAALPLWVGARLLGTLLLEADEPHRFTEAETRPYIALAQQMAVSVDNRRLFDATQQSLAEQVRLGQELANQRTTLEAVLLNIPAGVYVAEAPSGKPLLSNRRAQTILGRGINPEAFPEETAEVFPLYRAGSDELYPVAELPLTRGMFGEGTRVDDMQVQRADGTRLWLEVVGSSIRDARGRVTASVAIYQDISERKQAEAEILRRNEELGAINRIGSILTSSFNLNTILQASAREMVEIMQVNNALVALADRAGIDLIAVADYNANPDTPNIIGQVVKLVDGVSNYRIFAGKRSMVVPEAQTNPLIEYVHPLMRARGTHTILVVPLLARGDLVGLIGVELSDAQRMFSPDEITLVETLAGQMAGAVENIRLFEEAQRRAADLATVAQVGTAASTILDARTLLQTVVDLAKTSFKLYHAHIYLLNAAGDTLVLAAGAGEVGARMVADGRRIALNTEHSLVARAARTRHGMIANDVRLAPDFLPNPLLPDTRSELAVPLLVGDKVIGVFDVQSEQVNRFTEDDVRIQITLGTQVAVSLQNATSFTEATEARAQVEAQARRLTRAGWEDFLNAIDHSERIGFLYDQVTVTAAPDLEQALAPTDEVFSLPLTVTGEAVGLVQLENNPGQTWSHEQEEIMRAVTLRLAQQIENLRLLDQAERYRSEAEQAVRRLTQQGWSGFQKAREAPAYVYDQNQVTVLGPTIEQAPALAHAILVRGEAIGQVTLEGTGTLDDTQTELVSMITSRLGAHIENLRLLNETERRTQELAALNDLGRVISGELNQAQILQALTSHVQELMTMDVFWVALHRPETNTLVWPVMYEAGEYSQEEEGPLAAFPFANETFRSRQPRLLQRTAAEVEAIARQREPEAHPPSGSIMAVPLIVGTHVLGVISVQAYALQNYTQDQLNLLVGIAGQVAIALENARLFDQTQLALAETEELYGISAQLNAATEAVGIVRAVAQPALAEGGSSVYLFRFVFDINNQPDALEIIAAVDKQGEALESLLGARFRLADLSYAQTWRDDPATPLVISDVFTDARFNDADRARFLALEAKASASVLLTVGGQWVGLISYNWDKARDFSDRETRLYRALGAQASVSVNNLFLLQQTQKRANELETVARVSATASASLDSEQLLQIMVDLTKGSFGLYHAHVYLLDPNVASLVLTAGAGYTGSQMVAEGRHIPLDWEQSLVARAARTREAVVANDVRADPDFLAHPLLPDTRSELAIPMIVGDKVLGVFDVQSTEVNHFTHEDVRIQTTLATQVAVALNNATLFSDQTATVTRLRELDHLKSSFLANMSHELRTPLNSILGFTEVILEELDGPLTEQMENDLRIVYKNGQHLLSLINDVLDMAKIESGKLILHPEPLDATEILEEVITITGPLARAKNLELRLETAFGVEVEADRMRIRQVMINIINNALKFTETGYITVGASYHDEQVRIQVRDTGLGIPPDHLDAIFHEFTQVDTTTTRKAGGTGLGLPISRHLVEMHGGRLWAESTGIPGEGSTFIVELPIQSTYQTEPEE